MFCLLLLTCISGQFIIFKSLQYNIRKEIKRKIKNAVPENELHFISFLKNEAERINWVEDNREFIFNGRLYDVVKLINDGDSLQFHCINDTQEEKLFAGLDELVQKQMSSEKAGKPSSVKKIPTDYFHNEKGLLFIPSKIKSFITHSASYKDCFVVPELFQPPEFS